MSTPGRPRTTRIGQPVHWIRLYAQASAALRHARRKGAPGLAFAAFGRRLGWRLVGYAPRLGVRYMLTPVDILRYFEFEFAGNSLPSQAGRCLDVSSPRLFSLYVAAHRPLTDVGLLNPSEEDLALTRTAAKRLDLNNLHVEHSDAAVLRTRRGEYDAIWSLSVVEHIAGRYDDCAAVRWMFDALRPGGVLILTVPVDRRFWVEYRDQNHYGVDTPVENGRYFFQRFYDQQAIRERLIEPVGHEPRTTHWFGETTPGRFHAFIAGWLRDGFAATVESPRETADHYRTFDSWEAMPGVGVAGLVFEKPR